MTGPRDVQTFGETVPRSTASDPGTPSHCMKWAGELMPTNRSKRLILREFFLPGCLHILTVYLPTLGLQMKQWAMLGVKAAGPRAAATAWLLFSWLLSPAP